MRDYVTHLEDRLQLSLSRIEILESELNAAQSAPHSVRIAPVPEPTSDLKVTLVTADFLKRQSDAKSRIEKTEKPWVDATSDFLSTIPSDGASWSEKRCRTRLSTLEQVIGTFRLLTLQQYHNGSPYPTTKSSGPLDVLDSYLGLISSLKVDAQYTTQLSNYSQLLCFCIYRVARGNGVTVGEVDQLIAARLKRDASSEYLKRLRTAAKLIARVIEKLEAKLKHLAPMLFLLYGPPMGTYRQFSTWTETADYLTEQILEKTKPLQEELLVLIR
ncbi:hypothetical protein B0H63DRAFT_187521 [Podospora didyma]|uniref:Uncharacterized protein n=1 Tax=Podospora didyma TaxID=330526 RepID=A0AAE0NQG0_9PEZI|nr:hypothetical protein B0H63DRAFT_187521 [Podospora didyma]